MSRSACHACQHKDLSSGLQYRPQKSGTVYCNHAVRGTARRVPGLPVTRSRFSGSVFKKQQEVIQKKICHGQGTHAHRHSHLFPYLHPASSCLQFQFKAPLNTSLLSHLSFLGKIKYKHLSMLYSLPQLCLAGRFIVKHCVGGILFSEEGIGCPEASLIDSCEQSDKRAGNQSLVLSESSKHLNH